MSNISNSLVLALRNWIERPLLNLITTGQYDTDIEKTACMTLGKQYKEKENEFVRIDTDTETGDQKTESDIAALGEQIMDAKVQRVLRREHDSHRQQDKIKLQLSRNTAADTGINHLKYATQSIYSSLTQSVPAEQNKVLTIPLRLLRFAVAIPIVVFLSLPLALLNLVHFAIPLLSLAILNLVTLVSIAVLTLCNSLERLPLYLYDLSHGTQNQGFKPSPEEKTSLMDSFCEYQISTIKAVSSFSLFQECVKRGAQYIEDKHHIPKSCSPAL
ncbi:MAG: hypothetical protein NXI01_05030 [Gammaproteobacteria bacterium]|nr:hypothetical protein [Gammaproteobacteria bacterium]